MAKDFYNLLGVQKSASKDEIKKAYRALAHKYHPDKQGGDEAKFKEINEAYSVLSDDQKRAQYDQFGQTFNGGGGGQGGGFGGFEGFDFSQFSQGGQGGSFDFDLNDILGSFFGGRGGRSRVRKGADISVDVEIEFRDSILGVSRYVDVRRNDGSREKIKLNVPPGMDNGEMIRYKGKGESVSDGVPGDLYVRVHVKAHKKLSKQGYHIVTEQNIKISEAILGTKKEIESVDGKITVKIPEGITHGEVLRVKGHGVPVSTHQSGDLLIKINIEMPKKLSRKAKEAIEMLQSEGL